jgi:hypothetical protein
VTAGDEQKEAADLLRRLLAAVESGELDASSSSARRLLRRVEGAISVLENLSSEVPDQKSTKRARSSKLR